LSLFLRLPRFLAHLSVIPTTPPAAAHLASRGIRETYARIPDLSGRGHAFQGCPPRLDTEPRVAQAEVTLSGTELANKIKKGQFDTSEITGPWAMILQVWEAALAA
jgi:hypothetical protein